MLNSNDIPEQVIRDIVGAYHRRLTMSNTEAQDEKERDFQRAAHLRTALEWLAMWLNNDDAPVAPATVAAPEVFCVGRAQYPARGGNVGLQWHVVGVADVPYRTCVPKNGELLFVLAASQREGGA